MARHVFFSFHYENDIWRVNQVRNSGLTQNIEDSGFWDASLWEKAKKTGKSAIEKMIDDGLKNTSVTAVLIGESTSNRDYVLYEIKKSFDIGNGLLGIYIHNLRDRDGYASTIGQDPFKAAGLKNVKTYDWVSNDGYKNFGSWVESAALQAGR